MAARLLPSRAVAAGLFLAVAAAAAADRCAVPGEALHWIADYCMLTLETDDEIPASACIDDQARRRFPSACASNLHFKRLMCETVVRSGTRRGTVRQCVADPAFRGRTVERGGVGG